MKKIKFNGKIYTNVQELIKVFGAHSAANLLNSGKAIYIS